MFKFSKIWFGINFIFLGLYLYLVPQVWILLITEKETLKKDKTIYKGLGYISIYELAMVFLLFGKIIYIIFRWADKIREHELKELLQTLEFFCFLPQLINFLLLIAQISYYNGYRFTHREEFLEIESFQNYVSVKIVLVYLYSIWLLSCFLFFTLSFLCEGCGYCKCCFNCDNYPYTETFKKRNNRVYAL